MLDCDYVARLEKSKAKYVNKRNICNNANRKAIKSFEEKLSRNVKEDSKSFYNYVRSKQKRKEMVGPLKKEEDNGEVIVDDVEAAETLNKYFSTVFTLEELGNIPEPNQAFLDSGGQGITQIMFTKET